MTVILTPEAEADLEDAHAWYASRAFGVSEDFLRAFAACVGAIERFPDACPVVYRHFRRAVLRRFPFNVFYAAENGVIYVHAIFHSKRSPETWQRRSQH